MPSFVSIDMSQSLARGWCRVHFQVFDQRQQQRRESCEATVDVSRETASTLLFQLG